MTHFFNKNRLFPIIFFSIGILCSAFLAKSFHENFLNYKEILVEIELGRKVHFFKNIVESKTAKANHCLYQTNSLEDECVKKFILHEGLWLYDMRIFRNDTLIFEKNINPDIPWNAWTERQSIRNENSIFEFDMKPTEEHLGFLKSNFQIVIFLLGVFIAASFAALIRSYQLLFQKKEELKDAKNVILSANVALRKKNSELEEYVHAVSHDLQEPLNTINGFIDVIKEEHQEIFENEDLNQCFLFISSASTRMRQMIKELLVYAKLGTSRRPELVDVNEIVKETLFDLTHLINESGATITLHESFPTVNGYKLELKLLFQNLLINAIKYRKSDVKPVVDIYFKGNKKENTFTIQDNGIGIDEKYNEAIFKLFLRLHNTKKYQGSGIGLAKCKKILDLHNGRIWVESKPWQGSKFHFIIPNA